MSESLFSKLRATSVALVGAVILCSCGGGSNEGDSTKAGSGTELQPEASSCRAILSTLSHGFYGCVTATNDVGTILTVPLADFTVNLYPESASPPAPGSGSAIASVKSSQVGFYELPAVAGSYWLCTSFFRCTSVTLGAGENKRRDYDLGVGPGW